PGTGDDIQNAVAGDVAHRDPDTAGEGGSVGEEAGLELARRGVVDVDLRSAARVGTHGEDGWRESGVERPNGAGGDRVTVQVAHLAGLHRDGVRAVVGRVPGATGRDN